MTARLRTRLADVRALVRPARSEEILLLARRPESDTVA
jgi:hypothetical protein